MKAKITFGTVAFLAATGLAFAQASSSTQPPQTTANEQRPGSSQYGTTSQSPGQQSQSQSSLSQSSRESQAKAGTEASKQELKVDEQQLHSEVTDANKASKIIGKEVRNTQGERVGKVKDLVIDIQQGNIAYAVLSTGGLFGGGKLIAVPLDALSLKPGEDHFLVDANKDRLAAAPGFSEDNWPRLDAAEGDKTIGLSASTDESTKQKAMEESGQKDRQEEQAEQRADAQKDAQKQKAERDNPKE